MTHEQIVKNVSSRLKELSKDPRPVKILKEAVSHFVPNPYDQRDKYPKVDISALKNILDIDVKGRTCVAEPGVTFKELVKATMKHGLIPCTVPELEGITIGGAISGCSIESMSYKLGGFHDSCLEYEVITANGDVIHCSPEKNAEIFHMLHGSYGTLGIISKITFKLLPAKPYVRMSYVTFKEFGDFWNFMQERCKRGDNDFIDGIIHGPDKLVVCLGQMVDKAPYLSSYRWLNVFYKSTAERKEDFLTIEDYFFRYDTECHWLTRTVPLMQTKPVRLLLGKLVLGSTNLIKWSKRLKGVMKLKRRPEVVVDVFIPKNRFGDFFEWYKKDYDFYPLWIVPYKPAMVYPWINRDYAKGMGELFFIDCAVYGKKNSEKDVDYSEVLEKKTFELNGIKTLISRNHFDKKTFWNVYDQENFAKVKSVTDPHNIFNDLYDKFSPKNYR